MNNETGFDNKRYFEAQKEALLGRCAKFSKLYLELGGKLIFDGHATRVLPGFDGKNKIPADNFSPPGKDLSSH